MTKRLATAIIALLPALPLAGAELPEPEYQATRDLIALVTDAAAMLEARGLDRTCSELRKTGTRWFGGETYVFILDLQGGAHCHPARPNLEGRSLLELRDPHGKPIVRNFIRELEQDPREGWVHYLWPKPGQESFYWKSTYVRRATDEGTDYIVGSGAYQMPLERFHVIEQVDDAVALIQSEGRSAFDTLRDRSSGFRFLDAYIFVMAENGIELVNVGFPELEGANLLDFQDTQGKLVSREMLDRLREHDGVWIEYMWPKPGEVRPSAKSSYVRKVELEDETLVVGAGVYFTPPPTE